ncbi:MAG: hypothetical protein NUW06_08105 [Candidatus Acetothermia bacterium]|jgi:hypothetical protein|nr:hypothetical protein [Candidatus Acetothermia bacterium]MDH7505998.1 hypothetical protein [Candidatus Acetothermia bacterium]
MKGRLIRSQRRGLQGALAGLLLIALFLSTAPASAQSLVSLFDIDPGVRPLGMGGAFTGLADDENSLFYNPAGLTLLEGLRLGSFYEPRFGASFGNLALVGRGFGSGILFFSVGGITQYDASDKPGKTFGYGSYGLVGSYALRPARFFAAIPSSIALGLNLKLLQISTLEEGSGSGLALDSGLLADLSALRLGPVRALRLGLMVQNLLSLGVEYGSGHKEPWNLGLRFGTSARVLDNLILALDLEGSGAFHLGSEYRFLNLGYGVQELRLRTGGFVRGGLGLTLGFGLRMQNFWVDYAFIAYPEGLDSHRLAFSVDLTPFFK